MAEYRTIKPGETYRHGDERFDQQAEVWEPVAPSSHTAPLIYQSGGIYRRPMDTKETNPKDAVGIRKWRVFSTIPMTVMWELGVAMMEGARKYGRHNYRVSGVRASVYVDAAMGHISQWWEGENIDPDSGLSHITKAIASLVVLRDAMIQSQLVDDRPPAAPVDLQRDLLQRVVDDLFERHPEASPAHVASPSEKPKWTGSHK